MKTWQFLKKNPELWSRYFAKEILIKSIRKFFETRSYHELESPILSTMLPQERYLNVVETKPVFKNSRESLYVIPTTERYNKIALAAGLGNHFVITKVARGAEQISKNHGVEFTMLEWYEVGNTYFDLMNSCEELILSIKNDLDSYFSSNPTHNNCRLTLPSQNFQFGQKLKADDVEISLATGWNRFEISDLFHKYAEVDLRKFQHNIEELRVNAKHLDVSFHAINDFQEGFELIFDKFIDPKIDKSHPYFLYNYPSVMAPLTKTDSTGLFAEKVELFLSGREIANGYTELTDGEILEKNFLKEQNARKRLGLPDIRFDTELVDALKSGMPEVAGIGMGLDRLTMILCGCSNISEINLFPSGEWFEK